MILYHRKIRPSFWKLKCFVHMDMDTYKNLIRNKITPQFSTHSSPQFFAVFKDISKWCLKPGFLVGFFQIRVQFKWLLRCRSFLMMLLQNVVMGILRYTTVKSPNFPLLPCSSLILCPTSSSKVGLPEHPRKHGLGTRLTAWARTHR